MIATMAAEGGVRKEAYLKTGCNSFKNGKSQPLGFWTEQDILQYIFENNLKICSVYGDIVEERDILGNKYYRTTGESRTGWNTAVESGDALYNKVVNSIAQRCIFYVEEL